MAEFDALFHLVQSIVVYGGIGILVLAVVTSAVIAAIPLLIAAAFLSGRVKISEILAAATVAPRVAPEQPINLLRH